MINMSILKKTTYSLLVFFSSCGMKIKDTCIVSISLSGTSLNYEIKNLEPEIKYIPMSYHKTKSNDTIIFEAYFKSPLLDRNAFVIPKMYQLLPDSSIAGKLKISDSLKANFKYFFRVFTKEPKTYMLENGIKVMSELTFIRYEKCCSQLIKAEWQ